MKERLVNIGLLLSSDNPNKFFTSKIKTLESVLVLIETNIEKTTIFQSLKKQRNNGSFGISKETPKLCSIPCRTNLCLNKYKSSKKIFPNCPKIAEVIPLFEKGDSKN